jgi:DNA-directed RNA polymerase specialized sigma24 family protein
MSGQEVFLRLWKTPLPSTPVEALRALLVTQAHGIAVDTIRNRNARSLREARFHRDPGDETAAADTELMVEVSRSNVRAALRTLPVTEDSVFTGVGIAHE